MTYNYNKLKGKIIEKFGTRKNFSKAIGLSEQALSCKLNGKSAFSQEDIEKWSDLLDIKVHAYGEYFFK